MRSILIFGIFLSLLLVYGKELGDAPYFVLLLSVSLIVLVCLIKSSHGDSLGFKQNFSIKGFSLLDKYLSSTLIWLWILIISSWIIGVIVGLVNGVDSALVFRNFFGMVIYIIFPVMLIVSPSLRSLIIMIYLSGMVQMFYGLEKIYGLIINPESLYIELSISELRSLYSTGFIVIFPLFMVGAAYQFFPKRYFPNDHGQMVTRLSKSLFFTLLTLIALIVPAMSKGYILATGILFFSVVFFSISYSLKSGRIHKKIMILFVFFVVLLYQIPSSFYENIIYSFSSQEVSNAARNEQFGYLASEFTILGNGLGSSLKSGYMRDGTGYGFELTYVNIVHKLGVFSIFLFLSYIITITVASIRIVRRVYVFESFFVLGLMGYLVVGAGNPLLLSPSAVVLHCVGMYILAKPFLRPLNTAVQQKYEE